MSIIHEALKRAERERESRMTQWPLGPSGRTSYRQRRWGVITGLVVGVTTAVAVSLWVWVQSPLSSAGLGVGPGIPQPSRAQVMAATPDVGGHAISAASPTLEMPLEPSLRLKSDASSRSDRSVPLALEAQAMADAAFERARDAESTGQWVQAERYYRQALTQNPALAEAHNNLGTLYIRQQQMNAAIDEFRAAIALNPNYAMVRNNLGGAYILLGQEELATREFIAALRIDGTYVSPYYNLASLYARRGDVGQAVAFLTKAFALESAVVSWVQEDPDFDRIRDAPELQRLRTQASVRR